MNCVLVRVDNRLVHGQIIEAWAPYLKIARIIVVDDEAANDFFRATVIKMAVPSEMTVEIRSVEDFVREALGEAPGGARSLVLFSRIWDALRAYALGFVFQKLNIGNIYNDDCRHRLSACVLLSDEDLDSIRSLLQRGVNIEVRRVPRERPVNITEALKGIL
ncbi:MAG: PTS sugar transporter subunit IIB [Pseudomonadota bacterium]|nr:PTS sugar transporter subunit IIB [Pseudomonadota bacterium]